MPRSKQTAGAVAAAEKVLLEGGTRKAAAAAAGVPRRTLSRWCQNDVALARRLEDAEREGTEYLVDEEEERMLDEIRNGTPGHKVVDGELVPVRVFDPKQAARFKLLATKSPKYATGGRVNVSVGSDFDRLLRDMHEIDAGGADAVVDVTPEAGLIEGGGGGGGAEFERVSAKMRERMDGD